MKYIDIQDDENRTPIVKRGGAPQLGPGEILIDVAYAGVNRPDIFQRLGLYPPPPGASPILGLEVSGKVTAVASDVVGWSPGDPVCALTNGGGYAEQVAVPAGQCLPVPAGYSLIEAGALPETLFTVWSNVYMRAALSQGEWLLVHGGASGIGSMAIMLAKSLGNPVAVTVGSQEKADFCRRLGADLVIDYSSEDFVDVIHRETEGRGVDVILDMVGGDYVQQNIKVAAAEGRIVNIAFLQGAKVSINMTPVMLKRLTLTGSTLRPLSRQQKEAIAIDLRERVWSRVEDGRITPVIDRVFSIDEVELAHQMMSENKVMGKIVLAVSDNQ